MLIDGFVKRHERLQHKIINRFLRDDVTQNGLMSLEDTESRMVK